MENEPIRALVAALIAILAALQALGVVDANAAANITSVLLLLTGGEVVRAKVTPVSR